MSRYFSNREMLILDYLKRHDLVTSDELANYLSVSKRTVKKDIAYIREVLNQGQEILQSVHGKGYALSKAYMSVIDHNFLSRDKDLILNNYDRIAYIIQRLLLSETEIRYENLADELFISPSSLSKDMKKVRSFLREYQLTIEHRPAYGVRIKGSEFNRRMAISYFFYHSFLAYLTTYRQTVYKQDAIILTYIEKIIREVCTDSYIKVSSNTIKDISIHIFIAFERMEYEAGLSELDEKIDFRSYQAASEIVQRVSGFIKSKESSKATIDYIYLHLSHKRMLSTHMNTASEEIKATIKEINLEIKQNFDIDFSSDWQLNHALELHLQQLIKRVENEVSIPNPYVFQHFRDYLFAAKICISAIQIIEKNLLTHDVPLDEYGYLILYYQYGLNQQSTQKYRIALYTGNNRAEEMMYETYLQTLLNESLYQIKVISSLEQFDDRFDALISTVADRQLKKSSKLTMTNVTKNDLLDIESHFRRKVGIKTLLKKYLTEASIVRLNATSKKEAEEQIICHLEQNGFLKEDYPKRKLEYHEVGNGMVHIQDLNKMIKHRVCLIVHLTHPILWEKTVIKSLFLIKTKKDGDRDLTDLCDIFSNWANFPDKIQEVYETQDYLEVIQILGQQ